MQRDKRVINSFLLLNDIICCPHKPISYPDLVKLAKFCFIDCLSGLTHLSISGFTVIWLHALYNKVRFSLKTACRYMVYNVKAALCQERTLLTLQCFNQWVAGQDRAGDGLGFLSVSRL